MHELRRESRRLWQGAFILTAAGVLVKILSAVYRMPYQNFAGDIGFYVYQQIYPFYALAVALGGTGFPIVISKYIAETRQVGRPDSKSYVQYHARLALFFLCGSIFLLLLLFSGSLAQAMGDERLAPLLRIAAWIYIFVPFIAVLRGAFQGIDQNMLPTAVSQIGEQFIRVVMIISAAWFLFQHHAGPYQFGEAAIGASVLAPTASLLILLFFRWRSGYRHKGKRSISIVLDWLLVGRLLLSGALFSILALPLAAFQLVDSLSVIRLLRSAAIANPEAIKGVYDRAYVLTQFGMIASAALTAALVPGLATLASNRKLNEIRRQTTLAIKISFAFGLAASCGLAVLSGPVNIMLFRNNHGALSFAIIAFTMLTLSLILTTSGVFAAMGHPFLPFLFLCVGTAVKVALNLFLIPVFSIAGAAVATCGATAIAAGLSIWTLRRLRLINGWSFASSGKLLIAAVVMGTAVYGVEQLIGAVSRVQAAATAFTGSVMGAAVFVLMLIIFRYFNSSDLARLPITVPWSAKHRRGTQRNPKM